MSTRRTSLTFNRCMRPWVMTVVGCLLIAGVWTGMVSTAQGDPSEVFAVIDRFEDGGIAVLLVGESEVERLVAADELPAGAQPGTWLDLQLGGSEVVGMRIDQELTRDVGARVKAKLARLRRR